MAQNSRTSDLTTGPLLQKIILFALPLAASSILQLLFNAADVVVVGRFAGGTRRWLRWAPTVPSSTCWSTSLWASRVGANVVAARCFGARDEKGVQDTVHTSVALGLDLRRIVLAVVGLLGGAGCCWS